VIAALAMVTIASGGYQARAASDAIRVLAIDGDTGDVTILDGANGDVAARFTTGATGFTPVYASEDGRYFIVNHYEGEHVTLIDSGLHAEPHGDHVDLHVETPFVRATLPLGEGASHAWTHDGRIIIAHDVDGSVAVFEEDQLATDLTPTLFSIEPEEHAAIATLGDSLLVGYYGLGRIDAWSLDGTLQQEDLATCTEAHGEAQQGETIWFGCGEGVTGVTLEASGDFVSRTIPYPDADAATPETAGNGATPEASESPRAFTLATHHDSPVIVGDYGDGLVSIDPEAGTMESLDLPAAPLAFEYDSDGEQVVVLTADGHVHGIDPAAGEVAWSTDSVTPYAEVQTNEDEFNYYPLITTAGPFAYIPDPGSGEIVAIDTSSGEIAGRYEVGGRPARVVAVTASGVEH
jgi:hypothetical protein